MKAFETSSVASFTLPLFGIASGLQLRRKVPRKKDSGLGAEEGEACVNTPGLAVVVRGSVLPEKSWISIVINLCFIKITVYMNV